MRPLSSKRLRPPPASTTPRMIDSGEPSPESSRQHQSVPATADKEEPPVVVIARDPAGANDENSSAQQKHKAHGGERKKAHQKPKPKRTRSEEERSAVAAAKVAAKVKAATSAQGSASPTRVQASPTKPSQPSEPTMQHAAPPSPAHPIDERAHAITGELPEALRQRIDAMKRELRRSHEDGLGKASTRREARKSHDEQVATDGNSRGRSFKTTAAAAPASPRSPPKAAGSATHVGSGLAGGSADAFIGSPRAGPPTPRKQAISPPTAIEESEMAMFVQVESERRRKQQEATGYSPAAKLRDFRKDMSGGLADGGSTTSDANASAAGCHAARSSQNPRPAERDASRGEPSCGRPHSSKHERRKAERAAERARAKAAQAASETVAEMGNDGATAGRRGGGGTSSGSPFGQRATAVARSLSKSFARSSPELGARQQQAKQQAQQAQQAQQVQQAAKSGVQGLKERQQREAREQKARDQKRAQADRLLAAWHERHRGDVYAMMGSVKVFTDIFTGGDPLAGKALPRGDAQALKKAWHKLAARLHPDRQQDADTATQVLAEEVFKALTMAYTKEVERIEKASSGRV
jgi:hypothetical protein